MSLRWINALACACMSCRPYVYSMLLTGFLHRILFVLVKMADVQSGGEVILFSEFMLYHCNVSTVL